MKILLGMLLGVVIVVGGVFLYFRLGYAPVATNSRPMPFEATMAEAALHARMAREAPSTSPIQPDQANLAAGARIYQESCAVCHGKQAEAETKIAQGMFPKPPQFFAHTAAENHPAGETFWAVKNGIRLTGMPGFGQSMTEEQIWQVSLYLSERDKR
jgi:mono/diheme cytochrome c family protein